MKELVIISESFVVSVWGNWNVDVYCILVIYV